MIRSLWILLLLLVSGIGQAKERVYFLLSYEHGPKWNTHSVKTQQSAIEQHRQYLQMLYRSDQIVLAGKIAPDNGTLIILRGRSLKEVKGLAQLDPAVSKAILSVNVSEWHVNMSSVRFVGKHKGTGAGDSRLPTEEPFVLERLDPGAPVRQDEN